MAEAALKRWVGLLKPGGRVVLVEGRWRTGGGLTAAAATEIVQQVRKAATVTYLTSSIYWGKEIQDERYLLVSAN